MRVGVSLRTSYAVDDPRVGVRWLVERTGAAAAAGLDLLSVGDHHATGPVAYYQNAPALGRLLAGWTGRAGALFLLPLWHPVVVAEQVGTLASMSAGRFVLQCGLGDRRQCRAMGVSPAERVPRFVACLDVVRRLLAGEAVTATGGPWNVDRARVAPVPPDGVEVWVGANVPAAIDRAARLGDAWYAGPGTDLDEAGAQLELYRERCAAHGRTPSCIPIRRDVYVGASAADVRHHVEPVVERGHRGFPPGALIAGTVEQVAEQLHALAGVGFTDVVVRQLVEDQRAAVASIERLGEVRRLVLDA